MTRAGTVAMETSSKLKAIDKLVPNLETMVLTIYDKDRLATRETT
jgi:hypothetical protein